MFLLGFPFRACMYQCPKLGWNTKFVHFRILRTMWGFCWSWSYFWKRGECRGEESWENWYEGISFVQNTDFPLAFCHFYVCLCPDFSVQFLFCSFIWDWRGGFSLSKDVLFAGELWHACSGWLKLSEQSLLVSAPCPGGRPYPGYPLLAHCRPGSRLVCWRVVQSHLRERWTCETWFCTLGLKGRGYLVQVMAPWFFFFSRVLDFSGL